MSKVTFRCHPGCGLLACHIEQWEFFFLLLLFCFFLFVCFFWLQRLMTMKLRTLHLSEHFVHSQRLPSAVKVMLGWTEFPAFLLGGFLSSDWGPGSSPEGCRVNESEVRIPGGGLGEGLQAGRGQKELTYDREIWRVRGDKLTGAWGLTVTTISWGNLMNFQLLYARYPHTV